MVLRVGRDDILNATFINGGLGSDVHVVTTVRILAALTLVWPVMVSLKQTGDAPATAPRRHHERRYRR